MMTLGHLLFNLRAQDIVQIKTASGLTIYHGEMQHMEPDTLQGCETREVIGFVPRQDIVMRSHKASGFDPISQFRAGVYEFKDVIMIISMEITVA